MNGILKKLAELLYPKQETCCACGKKDQGNLCETCISSIGFIEGKTCLRCGKNLNESYEGSYCPDCSAAEYAFERAFSCFEYTGSGKHLLHRLKYEGQTEIAAILAKWMNTRLSSEGLRFDAVIPVPMHENKLMQRGYNQACLIAEAMGQMLGIPLLDCIVRTRETKDQFGLDKAQRALNIVGAFSIKFGYNVDKYKCILLVDDIYTTGSTVNECSKVLRNAGIGKIYVMTAATGSNT